MYKNVIVDGPVGVGKTSVVNRLTMSLSKLNKRVEYRWRDRPVISLIEEANASEGVAFDGGFLADRVYRAMDGDYFGGKDDAALDPKTLVVLVTMDWRGLAERTKDDPGKVREIVERFFEEYVAAEAPEKMILDVGKLPANVAVQHLMWALGQPVRR